MIDDMHLTGKNKSSSVFQQFTIVYVAKETERERESNY